jgi:hypothetical protein
MLEDAVLVASLLDAEVLPALPFAIDQRRRILSGSQLDRPVTLAVVRKATRQLYPVTRN